MKSTRFACASGVLLAAALSVGCDREASKAEGADDVAKAAAIAKEVEASPDDAEAILAKHEMTEEAFEQLMFEIAEDPDKAEAFASKLEK